MTLVELVQNNRVDTLQGWIGQQPAGQDPLGYITQPGARSYLLLKTDLVANASADLFARLINAEDVALDPDFAPPAGVPRALTALGELSMPLAGLVDTAAELDRLNKEIAKVEAELATVRKKLSNANFVSNAPPAVVEEHRQRETSWSEKLAQLTKMRDSLG